jgi:hypothetical protein
VALAFIPEFVWQQLKPIVTLWKAEVVGWF